MSNMDVLPIHSQIEHTMLKKEDSTQDDVIQEFKLAVIDNSRLIQEERSGQ